VINFVNFSFALFTPPLGDYHGDVDEIEARCRDNENRASVSLHCVAEGEGILHHVEGARFIFDGEVEAEKLADPMMLRDRGEALIK
jgi:hypothetical protein